MKGRIIALLDINSCYASIAIQENPALRGKPVAVTGATEERCGIVLAANREAKLRGVKTGMINREAKAWCPDLVQVPPDFYQYQRYSSIIQKIYERYGPTEMFSIDEGWIDLTTICRDVEDGALVCKDIAEEVMFETGLTISVGVANNKVTAKLGSEYSPQGSKRKIPGTITAIPPERYEEMCYGLKVDELLGIGSRLGPKMCSMGLYTIGDLANCDPDRLQQKFGKMGHILQVRALGRDTSPVIPGHTCAPCIKSFGNSTTTPFDLCSDEDVWAVIYNMAEAVGMRMRRHGFKARLVEVSFRHSTMFGCSRQHKMALATDSSLTIAKQAFELFKQYAPRDYEIRAIGVRAGDLQPSWFPEQTTLFSDPMKSQHLSDMECAVDRIRERFGFYSVQRAVMMTVDPRLVINAAGEHTVHPHSFY